MPFIHCSIPSCQKTQYDVTLFQFPRNENLQQKWLIQIVPYFPEFMQFSPKQLVNRKVCIRHFEQKFLMGKRRLHEACPTLITEEDITTGIPTNPVDLKAASDHTYCTKLVMSDHGYAKKSSNVSSLQLVKNPIHEETEVFNIAEKDCALPSTSKEKFTLAASSDHTYCIKLNTSDHGCVKRSLNVDNPQPVKKTKLEEKEAFSIAEIACALPSTSRKKSTLAGLRSSITKKMRLTRSLKCLTPKCRNLYKKCREMIKSRKLFGGNNKKNIEDAAALNNTKSFQNFIEKFDYMQKQFFLMQYKAVGLKKKARRYTLEEKLLCLALYKQSPKGYGLLAKMFCLPNKRTLNRVLQGIPMNNGINREFFDALKEKTVQWSSTTKLCSIVFDEVQLSTGLNFIPSSDLIYGFVPEIDTVKFIDHALVIMIRGICASWRQPIAFYFCESTMPTVLLVNIIKEVVRAVLATGLKPLTIICDQGITNQTALKYLQAETRRHQIKNGLICDDTVSIDGNSLSIIYDPPHLLKGIRNNLLSKDMLFEGKHVKWQDIIDLYRYDCQIGNIRMLPKLTDEHVLPGKIKKMKVSNCTKVLSERVAATLRYTATFSHRTDGSLVSTTTKNTADAVEFFDKLFDSCNGSRGGRSPGKLRGAVKINSPHKTFWTHAIKVIKNIKYMDIFRGLQKLKSVPTLNNWITTLESQLRLREILFSNGVSFYYTRNLNQDPLENFFSKIRSHNCRYNNPNSYAFQNSFKSLNLTNMLSTHSNYANCEDDVGATIINLKQLLSRHYTIKNVINMETGRQIGTASATSTTVITSKCLTVHNVIKEKIKCNARGFTAGYVLNKLCKEIKCLKCKKTMVANENTNVHDLILFRERKTLKHRNLKYPSTQFIVAFSELIDITNEYLEHSCNKYNIIENIKARYLHERELAWLGCCTHKQLIIDKFIKITTRLQIFNWCHSINLILSGKVQCKIDNLSKIQNVAYNKYKKTLKYTSNKK